MPLVHKTIIMHARANVKGISRHMQARIQGGARAGAHPWDGGTRAEGAGSLVSRAERRDTVSLEWLFNTIQA